MSGCPFSRGRRRRQAAVISSAIAAGLVRCASSFAASAIWTNAAGDGKFVNPGNWDTNVVPDNTTTINMTQTGISNEGRTIDLAGMNAVQAVVFNHINDTYNLDPFIGHSTLIVGNASGIGSIENASATFDDVNCKVLNGATLTCLSDNPNGILEVDGSITTPNLVTDGAGLIFITSPSNSFNTLSVNNGFTDFFFNSSAASIAVASPATFQVEGAANLSGPIDVEGYTVFAGPQKSTLSGTITNNGIVQTIGQKLTISGQYSGTGSFILGPSGISAASSVPAIQAVSLFFSTGQTTHVNQIKVNTMTSNGEPVVAVDGAGTNVVLDSSWQGNGTGSQSFIVVTNSAHFTVAAAANINTRDSNLAARPMYLRGDGSGTVEFLSGFNAAGTTGYNSDLAELHVGEVQWTTNSSSNIPSAVFFDVADNAATWQTRSALQTSAAAVSVLKSSIVDTASGADLTLAGAFTLGDGSNASKTLTKIGTGALTISGVQSYGSNAVIHATQGTLNMNSDAGGAGSNLTVSADAGAVNFNSTQHLAGLSIANANVVMPLGRDKALVLSGLSISGSGSLDLNDNALIVNYGSETNGATVATVRNLLINGRNAGPAAPAPWNGTGGITSTFAHDYGNGFNLAIGYADNAVLASINAAGSYTSFAGQTVSSNTILVQMTYGADANLDGTVDGSDVSIIGTHFNQPDSGQWYFGDFDYSGSCDGNDISVLGTTFGQSSPALSPAQLGAEYGSAFATAFESAARAGGSAVPEPASLVLIGLAGIAMTGRRRRSSSIAKHSGA